MDNINEQKILHLCNTDDGSSGGPIMSLKDFTLIGIHYGYKKQSNCNVGTFIKSIIKELNEYKEGSNIIDNSIVNNYNNIFPNMIFNNNMFAPNFNNIYQANLNVNIPNNNINNNITIFNNNYINNLNNNNIGDIPIKIMPKSQYNFSIMTFPSESNYINIVFKNDFGHTANIIIPSYKKIDVLFKIYAIIIGYDIKKIFFYFNGSKMDNNDQREIFQVFSNIDHISVSFI